VVFTEGFPVSDEAGARLVQILVALRAPQTLRVPLQISCNLLIVVTFQNTNTHLFLR